MPFWTGQLNLSESRRWAALGEIGAERSTKEEEIIVLYVTVCYR
jgi:hypothetical protein